MKKFYLKTKNNEVINSGNFYSIYDAVEYFASVKKLNESVLLDIFLVTDK